jgi:hypothetical protein
VIKIVSEMFVIIVKIFKIKTKEIKMKTESETCVKIQIMMEYNDI